MLLLKDFISTVCALLSKLFYTVSFFAGLLWFVCAWMMSLGGGEPNGTLHLVLAIAVASFGIAFGCSKVEQKLS